jgi:hypothetical protein
MTTTDIENFRTVLNKYCPDRPVDNSEAAEAFHNLAGFLNLLVCINERTGLVPLDAPESNALNLTTGEPCHGDPCAAK